MAIPNLEHELPEALSACVLFTQSNALIWDADRCSFALENNGATCIFIRASGVPAITKGCCMCHNMDAAQSRIKPGWGQWPLTCQMTQPLQNGWKCHVAFRHICLNTNHPVTSPNQRAAYKSTDQSSRKIPFPSSLLSFCIVSNERRGSFVRNVTANLEVMKLCPRASILVMLEFTVHSKTAVFGISVLYIAS